MLVKNEKDFILLSAQFIIWRKRFPMFTHDVKQIQSMCEQHITNYSKILVQYRQTRKQSFLEKAQQEIDAINRIIATVEKLELMAMLAKR